jgi:hypothetical protein
MEHNFFECKPNWWYNDQYARLECGRSWVQAPVGSHKRQSIGICCFSAKHVVSSYESKDLIGLESGQCVQMKLQDYPWSVVSVR